MFEAIMICDYITYNELTRIHRKLRIRIRINFIFTHVAVDTNNILQRM